VESLARRSIVASSLLKLETLLATGWHGRMKRVSIEVHLYVVMVAGWHHLGYAAHHVVYIAED